MIKSEIHYNDNNSLRLITIYGIASAMSYLHAKNIVHPDLNPSNVFFNDFFLPKVDGYINFYEKQINSIDNNYYLSPETLEISELTKASNAYSFSIIVYKINFFFFLRKS